jgi:hypothetical protein
MRELAADLERRHSFRHQPHAACELFLAGRHHPATVVDLSRGGVFLESEAPAWPGALVRLRIGARDRYALVLRERQVPHHVRGLVARGFGLRWVSLREGD